MKLRLSAIAIAGGIIVLLLAYLALPYVAPDFTIRRDPSLRRAVIAVSQGIGLETMEAMRARMEKADAGDLDALLDIAEAPGDPWRRECALELLLRAPGISRVSTARLHRLLKDPEETLALRAAILLGKAGSKESEPFLFEALGDPRFRVVLNSAIAILTMHRGDPDYPQVEAKILERTQGVLEKRTPAEEGEENEEGEESEESR